MSALVADTHTVLWYLTDDPVISPTALAALNQAAAADEPIFVPVRCVFRGDGFVDISARSDEDVAQLILERLSQSSGSSASERRPSGPSVRELPPLIAYGSGALSALTVHTTLRAANCCYRCVEMWW